MKKKKELKDEFELDIEFEVDKNNRVDMNQVIELVIAYNKLFRTYKQLKTQLEDISEELELVRCDLHNRTSERDSYERELNKCLSQQKEFIKYLEDESKEIYRDGGLRQNIFKQVLQKYKEIIGVLNEKINVL